MVGVDFIQSKVGSKMYRRQFILKWPFLQVYKVCFEDNFIASTQDFYKKVAQTKLCELTVADYLKFSEKKMQEESKMCLKSMNYVTELVFKLVFLSLVTYNHALF